ncbi:MAG: glycosidase [Actinobacteria bacterium]|nr:glycosidase [Actinomycetota bacterium]
MDKDIQRIVNLNNDQSIEINLNNPVVRFLGNPILTARDVNKIWRDPALQVKTVHNAGIAVMNNETIMLFRSHLRCGISVLGLARSKNGIDDWQIEPAPVLKPATESDIFTDGADKKKLIENESGGIEDARITKIDDTYVITYSAYHAFIKNRVRVSLATTKDFNSFTRYGPMLDCDMRNVVLFSEKINGRYAGLFRPNDTTEGDVGGIFTQIRIGYTADWRCNKWEIAEEPVIRSRSGPGAFSDKIGPGAPPIKTSKGWLNIFHGVRTTMDGNPYVLGAALHDFDNPAKVKVSSIPILFPARADCRVEEDDYVHVPNVVFTCGAVRRDDGSIFIYYGSNDTVMNLGISHEDILVALCEHYGQDSKTGKLLYEIKQKNN